MNILFIIHPYVFLFLVYLYFSKSINSRTSDESNRLYLNSGDEHKTTLGKLFHFAVEKLIFLRLDPVKNNPRGNAYFLISVIRVTLIFTLGALVYIYLYKNGHILPKDEAVNYESWKLILRLDNRNTLIVITAYFASINASYLYEKQCLKSKWDYLAILYNKILDTWNCSVKRDLLSNSLAIDIITIGMWGHRSYSHIAKFETEKAINDLKAEGSEAQKQIAFCAELAIKENNYTESSAIKLLEEYQMFLMKKHPPGGNWVKKC